MLKLKNDVERKEFLKDYQTWGVWLETPELNLKYYRYVFQNGAAVIVTEYEEYWAHKQKYETRHKYCLKTPEDDTYRGDCAGGHVRYLTYTLDGCSIGTVVDYMKKNKGAL